MRKVTVFTLLCVTSAAFAMNEPKNEIREGNMASQSPTRITIPFKKNESYVSKMINSGKTLGKVAVCVSAVFLPSMYSDVTIDYMADSLVDLGLASVQTLVPVLVHSVDTVLASVAAFKCAEMFSSHRAARLVASVVGGASALYASGQLEQVAGYTEYMPTFSRPLTDNDYAKIVSNL